MMAGRVRWAGAALALLALPLGSRCGTTAPPPAARPAPAVRPELPRPVSPAGISATPSSSPAPVTPAPASVPAPVLRLAWVNPARCLSSCTYDPSAALLRVGDSGGRDVRGHHRVAATAQPALRDLIEAARAAGHLVKISSAFRSYRDQARMFETTKEPGRAARPGHSEHQLGTAVDLRLPTSAAIVWLASEAPGFGFALSYPEGRQRVTGYRPEPWHIRYVGRELAEAIHRTGGTVEEALRARPELGESGSCEDCPLPASRAQCDQVTGAGLCQGSLLTWCYDGALATVDCAVSGQRCGRSPETGAPDCL